MGKTRLIIATSVAVMALTLCIIGSTSTMTAATPTFTKDVAPILYKNCASCHRPGDIAPMSLLTYAEARPWAKSIRDEVADGTMPPWHADPKHGRFANDRSLTSAEKET